MKLLAIDTATDVCGIALTENGSVVAERRIRQHRIHNEKLVAMISAAMKDLDWNAHSISAIAISNGPGSFTGLRIGISVAKGLAFVVGCPVIPVNTLQALAHGVRDRSQVIQCLFRARAREAYLGTYHAYEPGTPPRGDCVIVDIDSAQKTMLRDALVITYPQELGRELAEAGFHVEDSRNVAIALSVAEIGAQELQRGNHVDASSLEPCYMSNFKARQKVYDYA